MIDSVVANPTPCEPSDRCLSLESVMVGEAGVKLMIFAVRADSGFHGRKTCLRELDTTLVARDRQKGKTRQLLLSIGIWEIPG